MNSKNTCPHFLQKIDELIRPKHLFLEASDEIYFLGEYTTRESFNFSQTNQLIINYKKEISRRNCSEWRYKEEAIKQIAYQFRNSIQKTFGLSEKLTTATLVPVPPSKHFQDPAHDDRNSKMLRYMLPEGDIRELIMLKQTREPLRESKIARSPQQLSSYYTLNEHFLNLPDPKEIWLFDDVITSGCTFRATHDFLRKSFRDIPILGFFIARAVCRYPQIFS